MARDIALIQVPYDSGHCEARMGCGPGALLRVGAGEAARAACGGRVAGSRVDADRAFGTEIGTGFELAGKLAGDVARARRAGAFPLVLAGNCMAAPGAVAGLADVPRLGIVWLDAHGDLNTPETTISGVLDGMALAVVTGRCWSALSARVPGFEAVPDQRVLLAGARALDPAERALLAEGTIRCVDGAAVRAGGAAALDAGLERLAVHVDAVYLHLDLDVHDCASLRANPYAEPGGPTPAQVRAAVRRIGARLPIAGAALSAYDPASDRDGAAVAAGLALIREVAATVAGA